jgi:hypothetical protein
MIVYKYTPCLGLSVLLKMNVDYTTYFPSVNIMVVHTPSSSTASSGSITFSAWSSEDIKKVVDYTYQCMWKVLSIKYKYVIVEGITAYNEKQMIHAIHRLEQKFSDGGEENDGEKKKKLLRLVVGYDGEFFFYSVSSTFLGNTMRTLHSIFLSRMMDDMHTFLRMREVIQDPNDVDVQAIAKKGAIEINKECDHIHASIQKYIMMQKSMERYVWADKGFLKIVE